MPGVQNGSKIVPESLPEAAWCLLAALGPVLGPKEPRTTAKRYDLDDSSSENPRFPRAPGARPYERSQKNIGPRDPDISRYTRRSELKLPSGSMSERLPPTRTKAEDFRAKGQDRRAEAQDVRAKAQERKEQNRRSSQQ